MESGGGGGRPPAFDRAPGAGRGRGRGFGAAAGAGGRPQGHGDGAQENGLCPGSGLGLAPAPGPGAALAQLPGAAPGITAPGNPVTATASGLQGNGVHVKSAIQQQEPLRQPRSSPPAEHPGNGERGNGGDAVTGVGMGVSVTGREGDERRYPVR